MQNVSEHKDASIHEVVAKLREELGTTAFEIVDHWEDDLCAIGLARPGNHSVLVYVATYALPAHTYFASLELPSIAEGLPYKSAGEFNDLDFDGLVNVVKKHLTGP